MDRSNLDDRDLARLLGLGRALFGAATLVAPRTATRVWTGEGEGSPTLPMAVRGMGARDMAIGVGTLVALENGGPVARWLEAGAVADAADAFATLTSWRRLPGFRRTILLALEAGAAWLGLGLAANLDD
ncbi:MAG: hypothetical protein ACRDJV_10620 [Actinomycetota bacterium]